MRLCACVALALAACSDPLPKVTSVDRLRLLAIRAEPPEVAPAGTTTLEALAVDAAGRPVAYRWAACDPAAAIDDAEEDCGPARELPLGSAGPSVEVSIAPLLATFEDRARDGGAPPAGTAGRLTLPVVLRLEAGGERLTAIKRVTVSTDRTRNQNPKILHVLADDRQLDPELALRVPPRQPLALGAIEAAYDFEEYDPDGAGPEPPRLERHTIHWFATAGELAHATSASAVASGAARSEQNDYTAPEAGEAVLWLVVLDGRGGAGWTERRIRVVQ